jgi:hypothetical protein
MIYLVMDKKKERTFNGIHVIGVLPKEFHYEDFIPEEKKSYLQIFFEKLRSLIFFNH